jgi:hypothetical protein
MTQHYLYCIECHKKSATQRKLFDVLYEFHKVATGECPACGKTQELHLILDFQLGDGDGDFRVVSAFLPEKLESWLGAEEEEVSMYPFLVVLRRSSDSRQFFWMPYWHVTGKEAQYGQHAMCLDQVQFDSLISQVQRKVEEEELELV